MGASSFGLAATSSLPVHSDYRQQPVSVAVNGVLENGYSSGSTSLSPASGNRFTLPQYSVGGGGQRAKSEVEVLLTASVAPPSSLPSRVTQDIRTMSEDALREAKLKRLLREAGERQLAKEAKELERAAQQQQQQQTLREAASPASQHSHSSNTSTKSSLQQEGQCSLTSNCYTVLIVVMIAPY
jgi:hypothetical protein